MPRFTLRIPDELAKQIDVRAGFPRETLSETVRESLDRYFYLLDFERREMQNTFTTAELSLMVDMCNGTAFQSMTICGGVAANVADTEPEKFEYWKVDKKILMTKLNNLTLGQDMALVDAIERFWMGVSKSPSLEQPQPGEILK